MLQVTRGNMLRMDLVTVGWKESFCVVRLLHEFVCNAKAMPTWEIARMGHVG